MGRLDDGGAEDLTTSGNTWDTGDSNANTVRSARAIFAGAQAAVHAYASKPKFTRKDFDYIRWYLLHDRATVFTEDDSWYLLVHNKCKCLGEENLCGVYETRPQICRDYSIDKCEYEDDWVYDHYLETPEQVEEYAEAVLGPRKGQSIRSPKPDPTKIIGT